MEKGKEPTPADLYKLDKYWQLQNELRKELNKLGNYQVKLCGTDFLKFYKEIYDNVAIKDSTNFHHASKEMMTQVINHIWCADGKNWSQRIWDNTDKLQQALNDELISCLLAGVAPRQLRERLMSEFSVSFDQADTLVRTEMAHIQTQATRQRYIDAGIKEVYVWADKDERQCEKCGKLHMQRFPIGSKMPVPAHPRCRCRILPVRENNKK